MFGDDILVTGRNLTTLAGDRVTTIYTDAGSGTGIQTMEHATPLEGATSTRIFLPWASICMADGYTPVSPTSLTFEIVSRGGLADTNTQRHRLTRGFKG